MSHIISWKVNRLKLQYSIFIVYVKQLKSINKYYMSSYKIKYFYPFSIKKKMLHTYFDTYIPLAYC